MASSKRPIRKADSAAVRQLKREKRKYRELLDNVWGILQGADDVSSSSELREAIDSACDEMIVHLPDFYFYEKEDASTKDTEEQEESALNEAVLSSDWTQEMAWALGITTRTDDVNSWLPVVRKALAEKRGAPPWSAMSDDEYKAMVRGHFGAAVLVAAPIPCTLRGEAARYLQTLRALQSTYPQSRRTTDERVILAVEMKKQDKPWSEIFRKVFGRRSSADERTRLRHNVAAHLSHERNRPKKTVSQHKSQQPAEPTN